MIRYLTENLLFGVLISAVNSVLLFGSMAAFGTTPGKLLAGVRVENVSAMPDWRFYMKREFKIWLFINTAGIPYISIIPCVLQYRRVSKGRPAWYDEGTAIVRGTARLYRSAAAALAVFLVLAAAGYVNMPSQYERFAPGYRHWTNPSTGKEANLEALWRYEELKADGGKLYHFTANQRNSEILLGYEPMDEPQVDPVAYGEALQSAIAEEISINSKWVPFKLDGFYAARVTGIETKFKNTNVEITVVIIGQSAWRLLFFVQGKSLDKVPYRSALVRSLLSTAKDINVPVNMPCGDETCFSAIERITGHSPS